MAAARKPTAQAAAAARARGAARHKVGPEALHASPTFARERIDRDHLVGELQLAAATFARTCRGEDGRYASARWPGDAWLIGRKLIARLPAP